MIEFEDFLDKIEGLTPEQLEALAGQLAQNPEMTPPELGPEGLQGMIGQMEQMGQMQGELGPQGIGGAMPPAVTSPIVNQPPNNTGGPAPLAGGMGLGDMLAAQQGSMPNVAAPPAQQMNPFAMQEALGQLQGTPPPEQPRIGTPFVGNLALGGGNQADINFTQQPAPAMVPGLAQYLLALKG